MYVAGFMDSILNLSIAVLRPVTIHQMVIASSQILSYALLQLLANSKQPFLHSFPVYTLFQVFASHVHRLIRF